MVPEDGEPLGIDNGTIREIPWAVPVSRPFVPQGRRVMDTCFDGNAERIEKALLAANEENLQLKQALTEKEKKYQQLLAQAKGELEHWTHDSFKRREAALREALQGILDIGKRDMSNPKYDGYFDAAREALKEHQP